MIKVIGRKIYVTRGDCAPFTISLCGEDAPQDGTEVLFTVKKNSGCQEPVIEKTLTVSEGKVTVRIMNADTKDLSFGSYEWDIRLPNQYGEGEPFTPMSPELFSIERVIGNVG